MRGATVFPRNTRRLIETLDPRLYDDDNQTKTTATTNKIKYAWRLFSHCPADDDKSSSGLKCTKIHEQYIIIITYDYYDICFYSFIYLFLHII